MSEVLRQDSPAADGSAASMQSDSGPSLLHDGNRSGGTVQPTMRTCPTTGSHQWVCLCICMSGNQSSAFRGSLGLNH